MSVGEGLLVANLRLVIFKRGPLVRIPTNI